jgi:hypothetical protein
MPTVEREGALLRFAAELAEARAHQAAAEGPLPADALAPIVGALTRTLRLVVPQPLPRNEFAAYRAAEAAAHPPAPGPQAPFEARY